MRLSMKSYLNYCDTEKYPLVKQADYAKMKGVHRYSVWRKLSTGALDFVNMDMYIPHLDEWKFVRLIIYNEKAKRIEFKKTTYGLSKEELNK